MFIEGPTALLLCGSTKVVFNSALFFFCKFWDVTAKMKKKASVILARDATLVSSSPPALLPEKSLITDNKL